MAKKKPVGAVEKLKVAIAAIDDVRDAMVDSKVFDLSEYESMLSDATVKLNRALLKAEG